MGRPGAALAALVRAHELQPAQASHLVNAAAVASSVGLPSEALALLDAAEQLDDPDRPAMGIPRHAVALTNRGQALALLGRHDEADRSLAAALAAEPLLSEANTSRSATTACTQGPKPRRPVPARGPPPPAAEAARHLTRQGHRAARPRAARLPEAGRADADVLPGQSQKLQAETTAQINRPTARGEHPAKRDEWTKAQDRRYGATLGRIYDASDEPDIRALDVKSRPKLDKVIKTQRGFWGDNEREDHEYALLSDAAGKWCDGSPIPTASRTA